MLKYKKYIENKGYFWLIIGKVTPSVKVFVPIIAGLSDIKTKKVLFIFFKHLNK